MNPDELAQKFEQQDFEYWKEMMLDNVPDDIDKREGSIIYDAVAPTAMLIAQQSLNMAMIIRQTYIKTATGEFLDYRAVEHGTNRYPATNTEVKAIFQDFDHNPINNVAVGDRFASIGEAPIFYTITKINDDMSGMLEAEIPGSGANAYIGQILPVTPNDQIGWAEITEISIPARDTETDEHLRARLLNSTSWIAYGGNIADYLDMISKISDVGSAQVYPVWQGPGTVKLVILDNNYMPASSVLVKKVKEEIDPEDEQTLGYGLAPIDHRVTVVAPEKLSIDISSSVIFGSDVNEENLETRINQALETYFKSLRMQWNRIDKTGKGYSMTIYRSKILSIIMQVEGVANATMPTLNGQENDVTLSFTNELSQLPVLGEVKLDG